jgi:hypothetical protein
MRHVRQLTRYLALLLIPLCLLFGLRWNSGHARTLICKQYETLISLRGSGSPVKAVGRACQFGGRWYLVNFTEAEVGR